MPASDPMTVKQVARALGLANTRVVSLIRTGHIVAVSMPAGPGTWRVTREAVDAYLEAREQEATSLEQRRRRRQLASLIDAWDRVPADEKGQLCANLPADLLIPLMKVVENSKGNAADTYLDALSRAYRRRTDAGVEELALLLPHELFWAIARTA
jgi:excisionase family DNA binding protein